MLVNTDACTLCLSCVSLCPSGALVENPEDLGLWMTLGQVRAAGDDHVVVALFRPDVAQAGAAAHDVTVYLVGRVDVFAGWQDEVRARLRELLKGRRDEVPDIPLAYSGRCAGTHGRPHQPVD